MNRCSNYLSIILQHRPHLTFNSKWSLHQNYQVAKDYSKDLKSKVYLTRNNQKDKSRTNILHRNTNKNVSIKTTPKTVNLFQPIKISPNFAKSEFDLGEELGGKLNKGN
jgi:hypothetical protein